MIVGELPGDESDMAKKPFYLYLNLFPLGSLLKGIIFTFFFLA